MSQHFEFKVVDGNRYLYLVEKRRTEKGPRNVQTVYVGTADTLLRKLASPREPLKSFEFGKMAALLHAAARTGLLEALQPRVPHSLFDGYSAERILFLQLAARAERPLSREEIAEWLSDSALPFLLLSVGRPSSRSSDATSSASWATASERNAAAASCLEPWSTPSRRTSSGPS